MGHNTFQNHLTEHEEDKNYHCSKCNRSFVQKRRFNQHVKTCLAVKELKQASSVKKGKLDSTGVKRELSEDGLSNEQDKFGEKPKKAKSKSRTILTFKTIIIRI